VLTICSRILYTALASRTAINLSRMIRPELFPTPRTYPLKSAGGDRGVRTIVTVTGHRAAPFVWCFSIYYYTCQLENQVTGTLNLLYHIQYLYSATALNSSRQLPRSPCHIVPANTRPSCRFAAHSSRLIHNSPGRFKRRSRSARERCTRRPSSNTHTGTTVKMSVFMARIHRTHRGQIRRSPASRRCRFTAYRDIRATGNIPRTGARSDAGQGDGAPSWPHTPGNRAPALFVSPFQSFCIPQRPLDPCCMVSSNSPG
jgi:hypothetical protein